MTFLKRSLEVVAVASLFLVNNAQAVLMGPGLGTQNTTQPPNTPAWYNVGKLSIGTGVYLGNGWVLTAAHLDPVFHNSITFYTDTHSPNDGFPSLGTTYQLDTSATGYHRLTNPDSTATDLVLIRTLTDPGLPSLTLPSVTTPHGTGVTIAGIGVNRGAPVQYDSNFNEVASNGTFSGYKFDPNGNSFNQVSKRWGTSTTSAISANTDTQVVNNTANNSFTTVNLSIFQSPNNNATSNEAIGVSGDSGGALFSSASPNTLLGILLYQATFANQPAGTALYGNGTEAADLATYASQIQSIVATPEPTTGLLLIGSLGMLMRRKRRCI